MKSDPEPKDEPMAESKVEIAEPKLETSHEPRQKPRQEPRPEHREAVDWRSSTKTGPKKTAQKKWRPTQRKGKINFDTADFAVHMRCEADEEMSRTDIISVLYD